MRSQLFYLSLAAVCIVSPSTGTTTSDGPIVDLGYGLWKATVNTTGEYYNCSNIRYGQAPVGPLRFAAAKHPLTNGFRAKHSSNWILRLRGLHIYDLAYLGVSIGRTGSKPESFGMLNCRRDSAQREAANRKTGMIPTSCDYVKCD
ncbi:hypothetical protein BDV96DRAFT_322561 [Lophiotrema nucula]|uniref:Carboxylesterase type B domain-containing protein n=1 Tax=Lophiotrema nucula TaxID=690887 RepID=A0A6A5ZLX2_9PLEO|nr:hypothetical protein BDV96DRAFT_322561 [Lophiotrema nucula]